MFADRAKIILASGKGGDGHVSFRREKYVAAGGPDGGDGGDGGSVIFEVDPGMNTLVFYHHRRKFSAQNGMEGEKRRRHGKSGQDLILKVPNGTVIYDNETDKILADLTGDNRRVVLLKGGRGGRGNMNFATATMQVPRYAQPGQPGITLEVRLELKLIADVGLVGFPNAGKSTFLTRVSNAAPKIGNYPFTTLEPSLGVVDVDGIEGFVIADTPGLIEGASKGAGLGFRFLRHLERTRMFLHLVDASSLDGRDPVDDVRQINHELKAYDPDLVRRPMVIAANKSDLLDEKTFEETEKRLKSEFEPEGIRVFMISAATGKGVRDLLYYIQNTLSSISRDQMFFKPEVDLEELSRQHTELSFTVRRSDRDPHLFLVEGPKIEQMLDNTNLDSERGFSYFQKFLETSGILKELREQNVEDGDTIQLYGHAFTYYE